MTKPRLRLVTPVPAPKPKRQGVPKRVREAITVLVSCGWDKHFAAEAALKLSRWCREREQVAYERGYNQALKDQR